MYIIMSNSIKSNYTPENLSSISAKYKVSNRTMKVWLEDLYPNVVIRHKGTFSPREMKLIIAHLGDY